jgi:hypothetical protein
MSPERAENGGRDAAADTNAGERLVRGAPGTSSLTRELLWTHFTERKSAV